MDDARIKELRKHFEPVSISAPEKSAYPIEDVAARVSSGQIKPGEVRNPTGKGLRRNGKILTLALEAKLTDNEGKLLDELVMAIIRKAIDGNDYYLKELWQRLEGRISEKIVTQFDFKPIETKSAYDRALFIIERLRANGPGGEPPAGNEDFVGGAGGASSQLGNGETNHGARVGEAQILPPEPKR